MSIEAVPRIIAEGRYCLIDLETTGLSRKEDQAVQIALGQIDNGVTRLRGYYTVKPSVPIKPGAFSKHRISEASLAFSPSFSGIAADLRALIGDRIVIGYGIRTFDVPILARQFAEAGIPDFAPPILDVCAWCKKLLPGMPHDLRSMVVKYLVPPAGHHDAWADCRMTWGVFGGLCREFSDFADSAPSDRIIKED
jgi:DNA polymerase III subunit epsilon